MFAAIVVGPTGDVLHATPDAYTLGLVNDSKVVATVLTTLVAQVQRTGQDHEREFTFSSSANSDVLELAAQVSPFMQDSVLIVVEDLSAARRVDAVRRDFVANVSHELKTPVGAMALLAEAVQAASDDPEAVRHFSGRMRAEAQRLSNLVSDLMDLSRLQTGGLSEAGVIGVDRIIDEAVDAMRLVAQAKEIDIVVSGSQHVLVRGDEAQLVMALRNLLSNAVAYSPSRTRVAIVSTVVDDMVEIAVTDQGVGIPEADQVRIFERFYRVDPARSRGTGGTGLGLALVKHVAVNHGGECTVWSRPGQGSTFTLRLPISKVQP